MTCFLPLILPLIFSRLLQISSFILIEYNYSSLSNIINTELKDYKFREIILNLIYNP
ncbi:uncharacterized protein RSE6_06067 [Rhynchosporium secalis]|uniref:Uncharacterized protein n=1 Tax=Rhynchosporium secalis TaxID=38038 RepID=A0A1E1M9E8_RHYSE|nr:uncharacterized protein RSE6_06067 [Rhynchosporium secalis]